MADLTPPQIVAELDRHIVGQTAAKKAVAVAVRNRWRRQQLSPEMRRDVTPKNIILIGPTGVGKTEIARRLAGLVGAPFIKIEATKFTEVGYVGRDVESIVRDLAEAAAGMAKRAMRETVQEQARGRVEDRLLDLLLPGNRKPGWEADDSAENERRQRTREKMRARLDAGELEDKTVEVALEQKGSPMQQMFLGAQMDQMDDNVQNLFERFMPKATQTRQVPIREARRILLEQEAEALLDKAAVADKAVDLAENHGIVFLDELDKLCAPGGQAVGPDVSRQGVQRDLLPVVEGTTVNTRYGPVRTDHVLFIAAGAFHTARPSDLMPELQGRFPIRVELSDLTRDDFLRILTQPEHALTRQYARLLATEGVTLTFAPDGVAALAETAFEANRVTQNIGARRLHTILEKVVEEISFEASERRGTEVVIDAPFVRSRLAGLFQQEDLSRFIL